MKILVALTLGVIGFCALGARTAYAQSEVSPVPALSIQGASIAEAHPSSSMPARQCYLGDVWEVYTRHLPCCANSSVIAKPNFRVYHIEQGSWKPRNIEDLFTATSQLENDGIPPLTIYYVHGNWMTEENTRERVQIINRAFSRYATRPYRLVVLSWPSERERGAVSNIRENAQCADVQAHYLTYLVNNTSPASQVSLFGFSFGGRTVTGALHLLGGGSINGIAAGGEYLDLQRRYRVTLVAPAVDRTWLAPNGRFYAAATTIDAMVNLYNSQDPVLRRFRFLNRVNDSIAAGFRGFGALSDPRSTSPLDFGDIPIEQFDCGALVGNSHDEKTYYARCGHFAKGVKNLFWEQM